jgi:hypothetical protein
MFRAQTLTSSKSNSTFLSDNVLSVCNTFTEVIAALSVLSLHLGETTVETNLADDGTIVVTSSQPMLVFSKSFCAQKEENEEKEKKKEKKEKKETKKDKKDKGNQILLGQQFFDVESFAEGSNDCDDALTFVHTTSQP